MNRLAQGASDREPGRGQQSEDQRPGKQDDRSGQIEIGQQHVSQKNSGYPAGLKVHIRYRSRKELKRRMSRQLSSTSGTSSRKAESPNT